MKKIIKKILFAIIVISLLTFIGIVAKKGKFAKLEGYMYSFAGEIAGLATDGDATSADATSADATSSNATSSNATSSNATSADATSSNAVASQEETIKINNEPVQIVNEEQEDENEEEEEQKLLEYDNLELNEEIIKKIADGDEEDIIITTNSKPKIVKELFEAIKGKAKDLIIKYQENEIIFNGKNITDSKEIDTTITCNVISKDSELKEVVENGIVVNFANNGELPGIAKVRIKLTDEIKNTLDLNTIYIYYYDESKKELTKLSDVAQVEGEYIEFNIKHNSRYLLVNETIEAKTNENEETETVTFLESHKMYIIIIGICVLTIIFVTLIVIVDKKTKGKANKE